MMIAAKMLVSCWHWPRATSYRLLSVNDGGHYTTIHPGLQEGVLVTAALTASGSVAVSCYRELEIAHLHLPCRYPLCSFLLLVKENAGQATIDEWAWGLVINEHAIVPTNGRLARPKLVR